MSVVSFSQGPSSSNPYFTDRQYLTLTECPRNLRFWIEHKLLAFKSQKSFESAKLVIAILPHCCQESKTLQEEFFITLLKGMDGNLNEHLKKLLQVCRRGCAAAFFSCATTKKTAYYSAATLVEMIDAFHAIDSESSAHLSNFPCYDEDGKECLKQLIAHPNLLNTQQGSFASPFLSLQAPKPLNKDAILALDGSLTKMKKEAIRYLSSLPEKNRSSLPDYLKVFNKIQHAKLEDFAKITLIKCLLSITTCEEDLPAQHDSLADMSEMIAEACRMHFQWGTDALLSICRQNTSLSRLIHCLKLLNKLEKESFEVKTGEILDKFVNGSISFSALITGLENLSPKREEKRVVPKEDNEQLMDRFRGNDCHVSRPLSCEHLEKIKRQYLTIQELCHKWRGHSFNELVNRACEIRRHAQAGSLVEEEILQLVAISRLALSLKFGKYLYPTQVLTVLGQLCETKGVFAQVKTGEGKSLIITSLAFVLVMQNQSVHVISSSRNLSMRDQEKTREFFDAFGVTASHICRDNAPSKQFQGDILFGTASDFEFAVMREMLYFKSLFPQQPRPDQQYRFDCAIIDELDNLTLDTATHNARLSYPKEGSYEWVYTPIFQFMKEHVAENEKDKLTSPHLLQNVKNFLKEYASDALKEEAAHIPDSQLKKWVESAYSALYQQKEGEDYVIGDRDTQTGQKQQGILIVDARNTGRIMHGSRWSNGLHEFVEVKHGIVPEVESLMPISLSHSIFYPLYRSLYGLTGTMGSVSDREAIKDVYGNDSFDVPTHRPSQRKDELLRIAASEKQYIATILDTVKRCRQEGRPILILCQTIKDSDAIATLLREENIPLEIINEMQDKAEEEILKQAGHPGAVTVATNTAGRGTDIILNEVSKDNGGLHVLLTFFPESQRVEDQARGRAGRQGEPGSSEIVISAERLQLDALPKEIPVALITQYLHAQRETRARLMKEYSCCRADIERYCFQFVQEFFSHLKALHAIANDEDFLKTRAEVLSNRKLLRPVPLPEGLTLSERRIGKEMLELLTNRSREPMKWKAFLQQTGEHLKNKVITLWSLEFYQVIEEFLNESIMRTGIMQREQLKMMLNAVVADNKGEQAQKFLHDLEEKLARDQREEIDELKRRITTFHGQQKEEWENYFGKSGAGIFRYLFDISGIDL